jgi:hypothetical protein
LIRPVGWIGEDVTTASGRGRVAFLLSGLRQLSWCTDCASLGPYPHIMALVRAAEVATRPTTALAARPSSEVDGVV